MSRSLWKGPIISSASIISIKKYMSRSATILPIHIGKTFEIHNGHKFIKVSITINKLGHKFGEFAKTKKIYGTKS